MKIVITADNTCDLPQELIDKNNIHICYIPVIMGDDEFTDNINHEMIYKFVEKTNQLPKTAALSEFDYKQAFKKALEKNDAVIHFTLSYGISSTGKNAETAGKEFNNVFVIDTKSLSSGSGLLVLSCAEKIKAGKDLETILKELKEEVNKIQASFLISKLNYLKKGGRCSSVAAFGANLLGIKVLIQLIDGYMKATKKYIGKIDVCLHKYLKDMIAENPPIYETAFITSSSEMLGIKEKFVDEVKKLGFKNVIEMQAGSTICSHCGPGTIGLMYIKK